MFRVADMKTIHWEKWLMPRWTPKCQFVNSPKRWSTCGSATMSLVTGLDPAYIESRLPRTQLHWSTRSAAKFLNRCGWKTLILPPKGIVSTLNEFTWDNATLSPQHLVMVNCYTSAKEASWFLVENGRVWHNFYIEPAGPLFLLRRPLQDAIFLKR